MLTEEGSAAPGPVLPGLPSGDWLDAALDFNFHPARYVHRSRLAGLPGGELCSALLAEGRDPAALSRYLLDSFGLDRCFCEDFSPPLARLALVDAADLQQLFLYLGALLRRDEFRLELRGARIREFRRALGEDLYTLARSWDEADRGPIPVCEFAVEMDDLRGRFQLTGATWCLRELAASEGALERLQLKLPLSWDRSMGAHGSGEIDSFPNFFKQLASEVIPKWLPLLD